MSFRRLSKLPLDQEIKERIARSPLKTVKDVLSLSPLQVMTLLHMSADECKAFMDKLFDVCVPQHVTAFDLSEEEKNGSYWLGNHALDTMLHGGLHAGSITEFAESPSLESLEVIAVEKDVGMLIVDSIASLARKEIPATSSYSNIARTNQLASWAAKLKCIAQQLNICVVVTNQVTSRFAPEEPFITEEIQAVDVEDGELHPGWSDKTFSHHVTPALGNTWTHCVNTRFILQYTDSKSRQLAVDSVSETFICEKAKHLHSDLLKNTPGMNADTEHDSFYSYSGSDPGLHKIKVQQGIVI
nr:uncharacterized protein LOC128696789 [Cherax quadricarinatus]